LRLRRFGPRLQIQNHSDFVDNAFWIGERPLWNGMLNAFGKWAVRRADRLRVVNTAERRKYLSLGVAPDRVDVLPVPVDLSIFERPADEKRLAALRARWQIPSASPVLFWVGRPVPFKDLGMLLQALALVHRRRPEVCTIFGGDFSGAGQWPKLAHELGLGEAVRFVGPISRHELADYFALCSIYLHASMYEGFGRVMVEAAAAGRPVVATRTAGAMDIVRDGETGRLCPPRDSDGFADSVLKLLSAPDRSAAMGVVARRWAKERFDPNPLTHGIIAAWHATANL
jgi:glycosyltransferase involved in cell wall biosynthesis